MVYQAMTEGAKFVHELAVISCHDYFFSATPRQIGQMPEPIANPGRIDR